MRKLTTSETYYYFKSRFKNKDTMVTSFNILKFNDKNNEFLNKKYVVQSEYGYYNYDDIMKVLKYDEEVQNTICYAQQLLVDLEVILNENGIVGAATKISKISGVPSQQISYLNLGYETALKCIKNIEDKIRGLSLEAIRDLKLEYAKVCEG